MTISGIRAFSPTVSPRVRFAGEAAESSREVPPGDEEPKPKTQGDGQSDNPLTKAWNWMYDNLLKPLLNWIKGFLPSWLGGEANTEGAEANTGADRPKTIKVQRADDSNDGPVPVKVSTGEETPPDVLFIGNIKASTEDKAKALAVLEKADTLQGGALKTGLARRYAEAGIIQSADSFDRLAQEVANMTLRAAQYQDADTRLKDRDKLDGATREQLGAYKADFKYMYKLDAATDIQAASELLTRPVDDAAAFLGNFLVKDAYTIGGNDAGQDNVMDRTVERAMQNPKAPKTVDFYLGRLQGIANASGIQPQLTRMFIRENSRFGLLRPFEELVSASGKNAERASERVAAKATELLKQGVDSLSRNSSPVVDDSPEGRLNRALMKLATYSPVQLYDVGGASYAQRAERLTERQEAAKENRSEGAAELLALAMDALKPKTVASA